MADVFLITHIFAKNIKNFFMVLVLLGTLPNFSLVYSIDMALIANCGLTTAYIPQEVAEINIVRPYLSFQDMGRLKRVSEACNNYWNSDNMCPSCKGCASKCDIFACRKAIENFEVCSKALTHFAEQNNVKMFQHLWYCHDEMRTEGITELFGSPSSSWMNCMDVYRGNCCTEEELRIIRSRKLIRALQSENDSFIETVLLGKDFDVFITDSRGEFTLLEYLCVFSNPNTVLAVLRNKAYNKDETYPLEIALHYALEHKNGPLFYALLKRVDDVNYGWGKRNATVLHRAIMAGFNGQCIYGIIQAGADVNALDSHGHTPMYYAKKIKDKKQRKIIKALLRIANGDAIGVKKVKMWRIGF